MGKSLRDTGAAEPFDPSWTLIRRIENLIRRHNMTAAASVERRSPSAPVRRHYGRAPVVEAIIEIQCTTADELDLNDFHSEIGEIVGHSFPDTPEPISPSGTLELEGTGSSQTISIATGVRGLQYYSSVRQEFFRFRKDGFSFHKRAPYTRWEDCVSQAQTLWTTYARFATPMAATRLGVRYINRLNLPRTGDLNDYLLTTPTVAPGLPQELTAFAMQVTIPAPEIPRAIATVRELLVASSDPDNVSIMLDIDVVRPVQLQAQDTELWRLLDELHDYENEVFERCITNRTRTLIS